MAKPTKFIFVTGGVLSGLGKGITAASIGNLLKARGLKVNIQKCDPYLNVDAGLLNPREHGECFVTADGAETDLDFGEPFLALSEEAEQMSPGEKMRAWALSTALEQREMLREFSSYFSGTDSRQLLEIAQQQGFGSEHGKRRMDLIDARFGG